MDPTWTPPGARPGIFLDIDADSQHQISGSLAKLLASRNDVETCTAKSRRIPGCGGFLLIQSCLTGRG